MAYSWDTSGRLGTEKSLAGTFTYQHDARNPARLTRLTGPVHRVDTTYGPTRNLIAEAAKVKVGRNGNPSPRSPEPQPSADGLPVRPTTLPGVVSTYAHENDALGRRAQIGMTGAAFDRFGAPTTVEVAYNDRSEITGATYQSTSHPEPKTENSASRC